MNGERSIPGPPRAPRGLLALVLVVTLLAYLRALAGELVYDDLQMIARNPALADLGNIPSLFTQSYWAFLGAENAAYNGYWRPLTATLLTLAQVAGGGRVEVFHAVSLAVHLGSAAAAFTLAWRLTRRPAVAFFASLLFALHPLQVESVAWITALNDPLLGLFVLLLLVAFLRWRERGSRGLPLAATLFFGLALLTKELAVGALGMVLLLDCLRPAADPRRLFSTPDAPWRAYGTLAGALLLYYLARVAVFGEPTAGLERVTTHFGVSSARLFLLRVEILGGALGLLAVPAKLNVFRPFVPALPATHPTVLLAAAAILAYALLFWRALAKHRRLEALALSLAGAGILPILVRVASIGRFPLSDRFLYLPVFGFALYVTLLATRRLPRRGALALLGMVALAYGALTWRRIAVWHDEETLFRSALAADPQSPYAHWGLGRVLLERARSGDDPAALAEAFAVYERAIAIAEEALRNRAEARVFVAGADVLQINLGYGFCLLLEAQTDEFHDYDTATAVFERALERIYAIRAEAEEAEKRGIPVLREHLEVEQVHTALGVAHMLAGRFVEAEKAFRNALAENQSYPEASNNYGRLLMRLGDPKRALEHFERALELRPGSYEDGLLRAQALLGAGWIERAEEAARELHARDQDEPEALLVLATAAAQRSDPRAALRWLDLAIAAAPDHGYAYYRRARALIELGPEAGGDAIADFRRAAELLPRSFEVRYDFGAHLLASGALAAALSELLAAFALCTDPDLCLRLRETLRGLPLEAGQAIEIGTVERLRRQPEAALEWFDLALKLEPGNGLALLERGRALADLGDAQGASGAFAEACAALPEAFVPRLELAKLLVQERRFPEAEAPLAEARRIGPPTSWDPEQRSFGSRELERLQREVEAAKRAIGPPAPDSPESAGG
jgi:tetratricopeptide (TPR) repeat protein